MCKWESNKHLNPMHTKLRGFVQYTIFAAAWRWFNENQATNKAAILTTKNKSSNKYSVWRSVPLKKSAKSGSAQLRLKFPLVFHLTVAKGKGKSVPLEIPRCPEGSRKSRLPDYMTTAQDGGKVVSLTHRPLFTPRKCSWYSFLSEAEATPGQ